MSTITAGDKDDLRFIRESGNVEKEKWYQRGQRDCDAGAPVTEIPEGLTFANAFLWLHGWFDAKYAKINQDKMTLIQHILLTPSVSFRIVKPQQGGKGDGSEKHQGKGDGGP